jgi:predicted nucleic acid-binding protein
MRVKNDQFRWHLSRLRIEPVTDEISLHAIDLLREAGLHGHKYAIDAVVAATALRATKPITILTSDTDDMRKLCGKQVRVVSV